jgi:glycine/D-amino acid oxidase-like deaminating enzyme
LKDVIVVGGGLAGLSAAWRLRHWDIARNAGREAALPDLPVNMSPQVRK